MTSTVTLKLSAIFLTGALLTACNPSVKTDEKPQTPADIQLNNADEKAAYAIGVSSGKGMASSLASIDGSGVTIDTDLITKGFVHGLAGNSQMDDEQIKTAINDLRTRLTAAMEAKQALEQAEQEKLGEQNIVLGSAFLEANKANEGVVVTETGLQYKVVTAGTGKSPTTGDKVKVHYRGTLIDGTQFDSSFDRGEPATFGVTQVISGWTEALQLMKEGATWQLTIPSELAYGTAGRPSIPPNSVLVFDVELIEVLSE